MTAARSSVIRPLATLAGLKQAFPSTLLTQQLSIRYPIIQAPMSPLTSCNLVSAVSQAGGMGSLAAARMQPKQLKEEINNIRMRLRNGEPFAVNLFIPKEDGVQHSDQDEQHIRNVLNKVHQSLYGKNEQARSRPVQVPNALDSLARSSSSNRLYEQQIEVILSSRVPVFSWTFGIPSKSILEECNRCGIYTIGTATTPSEALALADTQLVNAIVIQGSEAGGHRGTFLTSDAETSNVSTIGLMSLLSLCRPLVSAQIPLIAAGGIMSGSHLITALLLGASGVQMGTAFLTTNESTLIPSAYKKLLLSHKSVFANTGNNFNPQETKGDDNNNSVQLLDMPSKLPDIYHPTALTRAFSGRPARGIYNQMMAEFADIQAHVLPWEVQASVVQPYAKAAAEKGDLRFMQLWAGQAYPFCQEISCNELITNIIQQGNIILDK